MQTTKTVFQCPEKHQAVLVHQVIQWVSGIGDQAAERVVVAQDCALASRCPVVSRCPLLTDE